MAKNYRDKSKNSKHSNKRPQRNRGSKTYEEADNRDTKSYSDSCNDASWYGADLALLRDSASIPFSFATGVPYDMGTGTYMGREGDYTRTILKAKTVVPGVAAFRVIPNLGYADGVNAPVNIAASSMYTFIRHANSGARNYDSMDLMIYTLAMANVISALNWAQRIYGFAMLYSQRNRYMPRVLVEANHVNYDSVAHNLANFRLALNVLINKVASLVVPATQPIFRRLAFLYSNLYSEGESVKDQLYMYVPDGFYKFAHTQEGTGYLEYDSWVTGSPKTWEDIINYINDMIDPIFLDEESNTMSGDIMKAYGIDNCIKFIQLPEGYIVAPVYNKEVLEQMQNATIIGISTAEKHVFDAMQIIEDIGGDTRGWLQCKPYVETDNIATIFPCSLKKIMTTHNLAPEPSDIMVNSRLMVTGFIDTIEEAGVEREIYRLYAGSDIVCGVTMYQINLDDPNSTEMYHYPTYIARGNSDLDSLKDLVDVMTISSQFDFLPILPSLESYVTADNNHAHTFTKWFGDIDNFAVIENTNVRTMHDAALLSLYNVPIANIMK